MKIYKYILSSVLCAGLLTSCDNKDEWVDYTETSNPPTNLDLVYSQIQDNSGMVTLTPQGEGVVEYLVDFGDGVSDAVVVPSLESVEHVYNEGEYEVTLTGKNIAGKTASSMLPISVLYLDPTDLEVSTLPDGAVSNGVIVSASANLSDMYSVDFGEVVDQEEVLVANGETVHYVYQEPGNYLVTVTALVSKAPNRGLVGEPVEVEAIAFNAPESSAPVPSWPTEGVINVFSDSYSMGMPNIDYNPDWWQWTNGSSFAMFNLGDDAILRYVNLSYQGIDFGQSIDVSSKEFVYMDVWSDGVETLELTLISSDVDGDGNNQEEMISIPLIADQWNVVQVPLEDYNAGIVDKKDVIQLKLVGLPWAEGSVFIDNILFH